MGERPKVPTTGCCPVGAWQTCQPSRDLWCDHELGLFCRDQRGIAVKNGDGKCKGDFELNVTSRGEQVLDLEWLNFAPADYGSEYVVLYRENTYHRDNSLWNIREIGNAPKCSLEGLKPATVHFIRVAIWQDARAGILGKMTETINVKTRRSEFCFHMGEYHEVGEHVINDCEESCICLPTGEFECSPLCELHGVPDVEDGCHVIPGEECCDFKVSCSVGGEPCVVDNATYPHGSEFEHSCRQCTCSHGQVECHFPEECEEMEASAHCPNPKRMEVEGQCCPEWYCADFTEDACHYEEESYENGDFFISEDCGLCRCHGAAGVRCPPKCPPVVMVLPSLECPDPQIRKEGCCDTLHCNYVNLSMPQHIGRMFAMSYSPLTLTVSFETRAVPEESEVPLYCQYEILFANTSDPHLAWHRRVVQPVDVRLRRDRTRRDPSDLAAPMDALTRDNAIVVGERVYITLSGMDPDTAYYVKINPLPVGVPLHQSMMDGELEGVSGSAAAATTVVVKTMPMEIVSSCFYEGKQLSHDEIAKESCNETCRCTFGKVTCVSTCEAEQVVVARSHSCPEPRLERIEGKCCPQWKCYPSATGCLYDGMILSSGQSLRKACDLCTCVNASVTCTSVCQNTHTPPRPECVLTNITGQCCPQWTCLIESHPPHGVRTSIDVYLDAKCLNDTTKFKHGLEKDLLHQVTPVCIENQSAALLNYCNSLQIKVSCGSHANLMHSKNRRRKRHSGSISTTKVPKTEGSNIAGRINVQISLFANFSQESPADLTEELLQSAALQLVTRLNRSLQLQLPGGETVTVVEASSLPHVSYICDSGFSFERGQCVLSQVETNLFSRTSTNMVATDVTDTLAVLTWERLGSKILAHTSYLMVEHRRNGELDWIPSVPLEPRRSTYLLRSLTPHQTYAVRLIASMTWPEQSRWVMAELKVKTLRQSANSAGAGLSVVEVSVFTDHALVHWDKIPERLASNVLSMEIRWRESHQTAYRYSQKLPDIHLNSAQLTALTEDTTYTAEVRMLLRSGSIVNSGVIQFVTKSHETKDMELILAVCVSCAVSFFVAGILAVSVVMWRRRKSQKSAGGFVNHTFGVPPSNKKDMDPAANPGVI
ncbi:hypothetical protein RRG08_003443 [Elysia crispata]|uniref:Epidermal cell surface receptor n=1 Tax=Elysia crispata TaxID=231223 RepID=A0AAE1DVJ9_9GAST|nr:hypothetical protein RRG08_003443 [Elysia crispata]